MKRYTLILLLFPLLIGCSDFDRRTMFNITNTNRIEVSPRNSDVDVAHDIISDTLIASFEDELEHHSTTETKVEGVTLVSISMEIDKRLSVSTGNFDYFKDLEVYLKGKGQDEILIGKTDSVPMGQFRFFELSVIPWGQDFTDLIKANEFTCRVKYHTRRTVQDSSIVVKITPTFTVDTKRLGV